ncbi:MAG: hypothetical protein LBT29_07315 [Flavobacteriaceae bacterium]|jgi:hypothetical protein|nr:hypothetical protein [Flavobacteriaceae bacterium]
MKSSILLGIIFLIAGGMMFYFKQDVVLQQLYGSLTGGLIGIGIGLIFGSVIGYLSKSNAVKQKQKVEAIKEKAAKEALANANKSNNSTF